MSAAAAAPGAAAADSMFVVKAIQMSDEMRDYAFACARDAFRVRTTAGGLEHVHARTVACIAAAGAQAVAIALTVAVRLCAFFSWVSIRIACALQMFYNEHDMAGEIKAKFDYLFGKQWHCVVGRNFAAHVTHESGNFIYFYVGQRGVLLFKTSS